jgi:propionate CoA-transferase
MFRRYINELDITVLGMLQADTDGNVNVSKRGPHIGQYGGPGGFPDIVEGAKKIIFVGKWMDPAVWEMKENGLNLIRPGVPKIIDRVDEITFSGKHALEKGKHVYYVTNVGIFTLTKEGFQLIEVMPGIDIQKDILSHTGAFIIIPGEGGVIADKSILDGIGFNLELQELKSRIQ